MEKLVLASNNPAKCKEITKLLAGCVKQLYLQSEFNIAPIEETGLSFIENAILKARHASNGAKLPAIGDDSGLIVEALAGKPGIYSGRFAGLHANYADNIAKVLNMLSAEHNRAAKLYCVIALLRSADDPQPLIFEGILDGEILLAPRPSGGFGYDPVFYLPTYQCAVSELSLDRKNAISHRGIAINKLIQYLTSDIGQQV